LGDTTKLVTGRVLTQDDVDAIAEATAERLARLVSSPAATFALVDARRLAAELGVSVDYVYAHARELGGVRLGSGPKARIRFDLDRARRALEARSTPRPARRR
jgi:pantoate kinase